MYMIRRISILLFTLCFLFNGALAALCKAEQVKNVEVRDRLLYQGNNQLKQTALHLMMDRILALLHMYWIS